MEYLNLARDGEHIVWNEVAPGVSGPTQVISVVHHLAGLNVPQVVPAESREHLK